ncbi:MAG: hypothetical protein E7373_06935 [Clostridiales bacterium]|nr:hypothetical protein [Clostridiales bacterium]
MQAFLTAGFVAILFALAEIIVKNTTSETFRKENKFLAMLLCVFYCFTFFLSFPIGFGYILVKHFKNKN